MAQISSSATAVMRYRGKEFDQVVGELKRSAHGTSTMLAFVGMPKPALESAARELAGSMGRSLYRVDLQQVVSKYIGETEKNLSQLFQSVNRSSSVLLFDEADALFGKRTEVADAHDRFAGVEVGYLLDRLGMFDALYIALLRFEPAPVLKPRRLRLAVVKFPP